MPTFSTSFWWTRTTHVGETIRLPTLPEDVSVLDGQTFEDCVLVGPAVITFVGETTWDAPHFLVSHPDAAFWVWPPSRFVKPDGVIAFGRTTFRRCRFERITIAGSQSDIARLREAVMPGVRSADTGLTEHAPVTTFADSWGRWAGRWEDFVSVVEEAVRRVGNLNAFDASVRFDREPMPETTVVVRDVTDLREAVRDFNRTRVQTADATLIGTNDLRVSIRINRYRGASLEVAGPDATIATGLRMQIAEPFGHFAQRPAAGTGAALAAVAAVICVAVVLSLLWRTSVLSWTGDNSLLPAIVAIATVLTVAGAVFVTLRFLPALQLLGADEPPKGTYLRRAAVGAVVVIVLGIVTNAFWELIRLGLQQQP